MPVDFDKLKIDEQAAAPSMKRGMVAALCMVCLALGFLLGLFMRPGDHAKPIPVKTAMVQSGGDQAIRSFSAGGWIEVAAPQYPIIISSRIPQRLEKLLVRQGDWVSASQPLAGLYDEDIKTKLRLAESRARELEEKMKLAKSIYDRNQGLEKGAISAEELDRNKADSNSAKEAHKAALAEVELVRRELSYCTVKAPDDMSRLKVLNVLHNPGDWIGMEKAGLVSLYDPSNLQVRVDVPQPNIKFVRQGGEVEVRADVNPQKVYPGTVLRIEPLAELAKNTVTVRIHINEPDEMLFPEMVARVNFLAEKAKDRTASQLVVPTDAVIADAAAHYVFVCEQDTARRRKIDIGQTEGQATVVTGGLKGGDRVIVTELNRLSDGTKVKAD